MTGNSVDGTSNNSIDKQSEIDKYYECFAPKKSVREQIRGMKIVLMRPSSAASTTPPATSQRPKGMAVGSHWRSSAQPASITPRRMDTVVQSLKKTVDSWD